MKQVRDYFVLERVTFSECIKEGKRYIFAYDVSCYSILCTIKSTDKRKCPWWIAE